MKCNEVQQQISAFVDGQLSSAETSPVFNHIGTCGNCREFLQASIRMHGMIAKVTPPKVSRILDARVLAIPLRKEHATGRREARHSLAALWQQHLHVPVPAFAAGLTLVLLTTALSVWLWLNPLGQTKPEVVYVFGLPQVEVYATAGAATSNGQHQ